MTTLMDRIMNKVTRLLELILIQGSRYVTHIKLIKALYKGLA
jgi:hypothetical protein